MGFEIRTRFSEILTDVEDATLLSDSKDLTLVPNRDIVGMQAELSNHDLMRVLAWLSWVQESQKGNKAYIADKQLTSWKSEDRCDFIV